MRQVGCAAAAAATHCSQRLVRILATVRASSPGKAVCCVVSLNRYELDLVLVYCFLIQVESQHGEL